MLIYIDCILRFCPLKSTNANFWPSYLEYSIGCTHMQKTQKVYAVRSKTNIEK
jgi:hypothetical protein